MLIGYSAILIGKELDDEDQLITIEIRADEAETAPESTPKAGIPARVEVMTGGAIQVIPELKLYFYFFFYQRGENRVFRLSGTG